MKSLLVIAQSGSKIGLGHVMRTLAVAEAAREADMEVTLVSPDLPARIEARLKAAGIGRQAPDRPLTKADAILADGYGFGPELLASWRGHAGSLALMDDNGEHRGAPADLVINPNPHAHDGLYAEWRGPRFLLGSAYVPLRREFRIHDRQAPTDPRHILVTMGGSDPLRLTGPVINSLHAIEETLEIAAVLGGMADEPDVGRSRHGVTLLRDVRDMSALMRDAGIAVSAAGSSLWELAHLGVPTVAVVVADNQAAAAEAAAAKGMLILATPETVEGQVRRLLNDEAPLRQTLSRTARTAVDGQGAGRILDALRACI